MARTSRRFQRRAERQKVGSELPRLHSEMEPTCAGSRDASLDECAISKLRRTNRSAGNSVGIRKRKFPSSCGSQFTTIQFSCMNARGLRCYMSKFKAIVVEKAD